jgi:large subunit ribosomal protein L29
VSKLSAQLTTFRDLSEDELRAQLSTTRDELFRLQLGQYTNQVTSTAAITGKRRDIARILTVLRARELGKETQAQKSATESASTEEAAPAKKKTTRKAKAKS